VGDVHDVIPCAKFQIEIYSGTFLYDFKGVEFLIFNFSYLFLHLPYNSVAAAMRFLADNTNRAATWRMAVI